jgi:hypothetical protein
MTDLHQLEAAALARAAEVERELALTLPPDSRVRRVLLQAATVYSIASLRATGAPLLAAVEAEASP